MTIKKKIIIVGILAIFAIIARIPQNESLVIGGNQNVFIIVGIILIPVIMFIFLQRCFGFAWATLFTSLYAFSVPVITVNRNGVPFDVVHVFTAIVLAWACKKLFEYNKHHMREASLAIIMFLLAFTSYNIINYEMLFISEKAGIKEGINTIASQLDTSNPILLIDDNNKWFFPLSTRHNVSITSLDPQTIRDRIIAWENTGKSFTVIATGDYSKILESAQNIVYKVQKNLSFVTTELETNTPFGVIPLKKVYQRNVFSILKIASSLDKL